jgi:hypothetical protein
MSIQVTRRRARRRAPTSTTKGPLATLGTGWRATTTAVRKTGGSGHQAGVCCCSGRDWWLVARCAPVRSGPGVVRSGAGCSGARSGWLDSTSLSSRGVQVQVTTWSWCGRGALRVPFSFRAKEEALFFFRRRGGER